MKSDAHHALSAAAYAGCRRSGHFVRLATSLSTDGSQAARSGRFIRLCGDIGFVVDAALMEKRRDGSSGWCNSSRIRIDSLNLDK